jgi:arginyl-tRNA synthetase
VQQSAEVKPSAMSESETEGIERAVAALNLSPPIANKEAAPSTTNPLELCRASLTCVLAEITECNEADIRKSIQWPNNVFNGDLAVILPKMKLGTKADKMATEIMEKVLPLANRDCEE